MCQLLRAAASHKWMTSIWRIVVTVNRLAIAAISAKCREIHRDQHEAECKQRKAELHDKELFEQPDGTHDGECPLCFLPLPLKTTKNLRFIHAAAK